MNINLSNDDLEQDYKNILSSINYTLNVSSDMLINEYNKHNDKEHELIKMHKKAMMCLHDIVAVMDNRFDDLQNDFTDEVLPELDDKPEPVKCLWCGKLNDHDQYCDDQCRRENIIYQKHIKKVKGPAR